VDHGCRAADVGGPGASVGRAGGGASGGGGYLTIEPGFVERHEVWAAVLGDEIVGFYGVTGEGSVREIEHVWVEPGTMGRGVGRQLVEHVVTRARADGVEEVRVVSDPNAAGFYRHLGARDVGEHPSRPSGRWLPVLAFRVGSGGEARRRRR
jgi:ribosomal protein S18 acetylase RimI-like enzyme